MLTAAGIKTIIENNFADDRIFAIQSFIYRLIERKTYGDGINQYRIKNTNTNTYITSLADFLTNIDTTKLVAEYHYFCDRMGGDRAHPFYAVMENYEVELNRFSKEDSIYFNMFGENNKNIMFLFNYLADADPTLPIKIFEVKLVSK